MGKRSWRIRVKRRSKHLQLEHESRMETFGMFLQLLRFKQLRVECKTLELECKELSAQGRGKEKLLPVLESRQVFNLRHGPSFYLQTDGRAAAFNAEAERIEALHRRYFDTHPLGS